MLANYLVTFVRILVRQKVYSAINIFGLAVGLAASMLIALYITDELSYDGFHKDAAQIYRASIFVSLSGVDNPYAVSGFGTAETLKKEIPGIESTLRIISRSNAPLQLDAKSFTMTKVIYADSNFFDFFDFKLLWGDRNSLKGPNKIVITESAARTMFNPRTLNDLQKIIGKTVLVGWNNTAMEITGIAMDPPSNSHFKFDFIISSETDLRAASTNHWTPDCYTYLKLSPNTSIGQIETSIPAFVKKYYNLELGSSTTYDDFKKRGDDINLRFMSVTDIHLDSHQLSELEPNGNRNYVYLLAVIGAFILLMVCINFVNLSTARAAIRIKEVGIRKTIGAARNKLIGQFVLESFMYVVFGFILALVLILIFFTPFNLLLEKSFSPDKFIELTFVAGVAIVLLLTTLLSGMYPAFVLSSFSPSQALKGRWQSGTVINDLRSPLVIFQFVISSTLIISSVVIYQQLNFIQSKNLGFDKENIICITNTLALQTSHDAFKNDLMASSDIINASYSSRLISEPINGNGGRRRKGSQDWHTVQAFSVDQDFTETLGLKVLSGRFFSKDSRADQNGVVINRAAATILGISNVDQDEFIEYGYDDKIGTNQVLGIVENFNFESLRSDINPLVLYPGGFSRMSIRLTPGDMPEKIKMVEATWKKYTSAPFEYSFLDENINAQYKVENTLGKLSFVFTGISILIACLGLVGLVAYMTSQRTKEIGIRKVMGASVEQIVMLLSKDSIRHIAIAFVIAIPIGYYGMNQWLNTFAYRIDFSLTIAAFAGCATMFIALLTVSYQAIRAAMGNPVESLRSE